MSASVKRLRTTAAPRAPHAAHSATLIELSAQGPLVALAGASAPVLARTTVRREALRGREGAELLITFLDGQLNAPVIIGILEPNEEAPSERAALDATALATVDGTRVLLRGAEEILLQCGQASLLLRADGKVVLRGTRVETRARRQHRISAGSVRIN
ncbi:MAG TPA: DUF6484 domain-containing protein [Polyangiales bacterium]|nr:DUF6484 domain-containing protein [Polyangiales bacterium]